MCLISRWADSRPARCSTKAARACYLPHQLPHCYCLFPLGVACICVASDFHTGCYLGTQHSARWAPSASPADEVTSIENISDEAGVWLPVSGVRRPSRNQQWECWRDNAMCGDDCGACSSNSSSCLLNKQWERNEEPEGGDGGNATMWHASCLV